MPTWKRAPKRFQNLDILRLKKNIVPKRNNLHGLPILLSYSNCLNFGKLRFSFSFYVYSMFILVYFSTRKSIPCMVWRWNLEKGDKTSSGMSCDWWVIYLFFQINWRGDADVAINELYLDANLGLLQHPRWSALW